MKTFKTPKGTELPLLNLKGKDYLQVAHRLVWFREQHPAWSIHTSFLKLEENFSIAKAEIIDDTGRIIATAHKREDKQHFADHSEKAEAGSIGRALAYCGFGTQFCIDDIDGDSERIADAPIQRPEPARGNAKAPQNHANSVASKPAPQTAKQDANNMQSVGDYVVNCGKKYVGVKLKDIPINEIESFRQWVVTKSGPKFRDMPETKEFMFFSEQYLKRSSKDDDLDKALNQPNSDWQNDEFEDSAYDHAKK